MLFYLCYTKLIFFIIQVRIFIFFLIKIQALFSHWDDKSKTLCSSISELCIFCVAVSTAALFLFCAEGSDREYLGLFVKRK